VSALDEPLFVEQAVGGQEVLPVHVTNEWRIAAQPHPHRAIVEGAVPQLVEADRDLERMQGRGRGEIGTLQIRRERAGRERMLANPAFEEVAGKSGFGEVQYVRSRIERVELREDVAQPGQIRVIFSLAGGELERGKLENVRHLRKMCVLKVEG